MKSLIFLSLHVQLKKDHCEKIIDQTQNSLDGLTMAPSLPRSVSLLSPSATRRNSTKFRARLRFGAYFASKWARWRSSSRSSTYSWEVRYPLGKWSSYSRLSTPFIHVFLCSKWSPCEIWSDVILRRRSVRRQYLTPKRRSVKNVRKERMRRF